MVAGLLTAAAQILPTLELNGLGPRQGGLALHQATVLQYGWEHLQLFLRPLALGDPGQLEQRVFVDPKTGQKIINPDTGQPVEELYGLPEGALFWEVTGYVGIAALVLAVLGIVLGWRRHRTKPLTGLFVLTLLLTLSGSGGLFYLFYYCVPGFDLFRFHSRFLLWVGLFLAVLGAVGLTVLTERFLGSRRRVAAGVCAAFIVANFVDVYVVLGDHNPRIEAKRWLSTPDSARTILGREKGRVVPARIFRSDYRENSFKNAYYRARGWKGDLAPYDPARNMLGPNFASLHGLDHLEFWAPIYPRWIQKLIEVAHLPRPSPSTPPPGISHKVISVFNVGYVLDLINVLPGRMPVLGRYPGDVLLAGRLLIPRQLYDIRLVANPDVLPRAFLVPAVMAVDAGEEAELLRHERFDPRRVLLMAHERAPAQTAADPNPITAPVQITSYGPQRITMKTTAPRDCWLFLSDTWYPGWLARVDGKETEIHRANLAGRAIRLARGSHDIEFAYQPVSFTNGLWLTALGLVMTLLLAFLPLSVRRSSGGSRTS